jgi:hypothetical protein
MGQNLGFFKGAFLCSNGFTKFKTAFYNACIPFPGYFFDKDKRLMVVIS